AERGGLGWGGEQPPTSNDSNNSDQVQSACPTDTERALALMQKLSAATEPLRSKRDLAGWVVVLENLAHELGLAPARASAETTSTNDDGAGWGVFWKSLREAVAMTSACESSPRRLDIAEFVALLKELILPERLPPSPDEQGRVRIVEAAQVRALDVPHLFLAGLSEGSFPRIADDDFLYNEAERHDLNARGLSLAHRSSRTQDEMLLFYGVVTRARRSLVLSYPALSARGQSLFPSPYLAAVRDLFEEDALPTTQVGQLDPVPTRDRVQSAADLRLVATSELCGGKPSLFRTMADSPEHQSTALNILAAFEMAANRFKTRGFTSYEGLLQSPANLERIRARFPADSQFSATQLESYAGCPFRFFVSEILRIDPLESPRSETDYLARGSALHAVLAELHRKLTDDGDASRTADAGQIAVRFRQLVNQELGRSAAETELQKALLRIEERLLNEWADAYEVQHETYLKLFGGQWETLPTPAGLEVAFGDAPAETGEFGGQTFGSLVLGAGGNQVRIRGRIDRIDVGQVDNRSVFNIIDYKSGTPPKFSLDDVRSGKSLQLALYTLAAYRLGIAAPGAVPFQMGYWSLRETGFVPGLKGKPKPIDQAVLASLETILDDLVPKLAESMRAGQFPVDSRDPNCTGRCVYSTICRVNEIRPLADKLNKRRPD
ncbi:MAG: PD-(D/E)XK nuclease family protein, partial [Planctomycetaceae bacterium]